jgi:hypothetical protein
VEFPAPGAQKCTGATSRLVLRIPLVYTPRSSLVRVRLLNLRHRNREAKWVCDVLPHFIATHHFIADRNWAQARCRALVRVRCDEVARQDDDRRGGIASVSNTRHDDCIVGCDPLIGMSR